jgi:hypothetical protein
MLKPHTIFKLSLLALLSSCVVDVEDSSKADQDDDFKEKKTKGEDKKIIAKEGEEETDSVDTRLGRGKLIDPIESDDPNKIIKIKFVEPSYHKPQFNIGETQDRPSCPVRTTETVEYKALGQCTERNATATPLKINAMRPVIGAVFDSFDLTESADTKCISKHCDDSVYKTLGHTLSFTKDDKSKEHVALAVVGRNQKYGIEALLSSDFTPAKDWKLVLNYHGLDASKVSERCDDMHFYGSWKGELACQWGGTGSLQYDFGSGAYINPKEENSALVIGFFWKPIPEPGYRCLGMLVSNSNSKPTSQLDYFLSVEQKQWNEQSKAIWGKSAIQSLPGMMNCIREELLTEGKIKDSYTSSKDTIDPIFWTKKVVRWPGKDNIDQEHWVGFFQPTYKIRNDAGYSSVNQGLGGVGSFITLQGKTKEEVINLVKKINEGKADDEDKVWVINRKYALVYKKSCLKEGKYCLERSEWGTAVNTFTCPGAGETSQKTPCKVAGYKAICMVSEGLESSTKIYYDETLAKAEESSCSTGSWKE